MKTNKNIFLIVLISLVILMTVPSISAETTNNEHKNAGNVMDIPDHSRVVDLGNGVIRYDRVHYAKDNGPFINNAITEPDGSIDDYLLMGVEWNIAEDFVVNPTGSGLDDNDVSGIISTSLDTWDNEVDMNIFGDVAIDYDVKKMAKYNEKNSVTFKRFGYGKIAVAYTWSRDGEIIESDVMFNTRYTWDTTGADDAMDLQNIATHEFGHSAGLLDLYEDGHSELTMYGYSWLGDISKRDLASGDILGIHAIYGE